MNISKNINFEKPINFNNCRVFSSISLDRNKANNDLEALFFFLFDGMKLSSDTKNYNNSIYYYKNGERVLKIENNRLWISCEIWSLLEYRICKRTLEVKEKYEKVEEFIKEMVEKYLKWTGFKFIFFFTNIKY